MALFISLYIKEGKKPGLSASTNPGGVLAVYMRGGGSDVLFRFENLNPRYFLGQEICHILFLVLKSV